MVDIATLQRAIASDPDDVQARATLIQLRYRNGDRNAIFEPLTDIVSWEEAPTEIQDIVISGVAAELKSHGYELVYNQEIDYLVWGEAFKHFNRGLPVRTTNEVAKALKPQQTYKKEFNRVAFFRSIKTGIEFSLIPGSDDAGPLLVARWPVTIKEFHGIDENGWIPVTNKGIAQVLDFCRQNDFDIPTLNQWEWACNQILSNRTQNYWKGRFDPNFVWYLYNARYQVCVDCAKANKGRYFKCNHNNHSQKMPVNLHVNQRRWNKYGLVDMIGNVKEFVFNNTHPREPYVIIGGSYLDHHRVFAEDRPLPVDIYGADMNLADVGFRVVKPLHTIL